MNDFDQFRRYIAPWCSAYTSASVSYVGLISHVTQETTLLTARIRLGTDCLGDVVEADIGCLHSELIIAGREIIRINDKFDALLEKIREGMVPTSEADFRIPRLNDRLNAYFGPIYFAPDSDPAQIPFLRVSGADIHQSIANHALTLEHMDLMLKVSDEPYDDLDELMMSFDAPTRAQTNRTMIEVIATPPARILDDSNVQNGKVSLSCSVASALNRADIKLGYKLLTHSGIVRGSVLGDNMSWDDSTPCALASYELPADDASGIRCFLSYQGLMVHERSFSNPCKHINSRYALHEAFDPELALLREFLDGKTQGAGADFELAVAWLFTILGFSVAHHGKVPKLQDGPDLLAITATGNILVMECTTASLDHKDKLTKLVSRTHTVKEHLKGALSTTHSIQPAIVTPLPREKVEGDIAKAARHGIAVLTHEELQALLDNDAQLPPDSDRIFKRTNQWVPSVSPSFLNNY